MDTVVTAVTETVLPLVTSVFTAITANPLLVVFLGASLLGVGIGVFRRLRSVAK